MIERLQKILAQAGIASRRAAEELIISGRVAVNGRVVTELGTKADQETDVITLDGKVVEAEKRRVYVLLNKPAGYVTTLSDPQGRPIVSELLKAIPERLFPVGRLDYNTEGLLLLTNDGALANRLMHPRHEVEKEYHVRVRGAVTPEQLASLSRGVRIEDGMTAPARVSVMKTSDNNTWISIAIHEGRYRQVRRMCAAVGLTVVRLKRARYGFLELGALRPGEYRFLSNEEIKALNQADKGSGRPVAGRPTNVPAGRLSGEMTEKTLVKKPRRRVE